MWAEVMAHGSFPYAVKITWGYTLAAIMQELFVLTSSLFQEYSCTHLTCGSEY